MKKGIKQIIIGVVIALAVIGGWLLWQYIQTPALPAGFASGNGRIEAREYDIATKHSGRILDVLVNEGDMVESGQALARMDTKDLEAELREANAVLREAREGENYADAIVAQRKSELVYATAELKRALQLVKNGHISQEKVDQSRTAKDSAEAALRAARVKVVQSEAAIEAAVARTERLNIDIDDSVLKTPIPGRVLYRLAEPREILPAGGKVLTVLELTDVYMTIYLPTNQVGKVTVGSEARIKIDAMPLFTVPATVSFVAPEAQFTPREVETRSEREKLMFRIKVKIDPELLKERIKRVKTGLPGVAYVRLDQNSEWPESLQVKLPQ
ncbi:MAG: HlyD family efflux transporter periplasmic adaptor subunit [Gammaproteobacteria bacterium]|jgi:HlyD family secretion protein|nr:HlyD family efflux transporter periplasmic adaptor subunit [Gammaproteobacteria bacterium]